MSTNPQEVRDYAVQEAKRVGAALVQPPHVVMAVASLLGQHNSYDIAREQVFNTKLPWPDPPLMISDEAWSYIVRCVDDAAAMQVLDEIGAAMDTLRGQAETAIGRTLNTPLSSDGTTGPAATATTNVSTTNSTRTLEECLAELDSLVGLGSVKDEVRRLLAAHRANAVLVAGGKPAVPMSLHLVFTGNPGTGKTTVARIVADLYRAAGLLPQGQLIETDRSGLVGGYVGQTALIVDQVLQQALGGVLFIDEAYSLTPTSAEDYGSEAISTLVKAMEDHRSELAIIAAGYREPMAYFVESNPGLKSRFKTFIDFPDYSSAELMEIFELLCKAQSFKLTPTVRKAVLARIEAQPADPMGGNARFVRSLFEDMFKNMAERAGADGQLELGELLSFHISDVPPAPDSDRPPVGFTS